MEWKGGNLRGSVYRSTSGYRVEIAIRGERFVQAFLIRDFDSSWENAELAAREWHEVEFRKNGWVYHPWKETNNPTVVEVLLNNGVDTMKLDKDDLPLLDNLKGIGCRTDVCGVKYATYSEKGAHLFHRLVCPQWKRVDHINRNGLDNRRCNLRDGMNGVNCNNRRLHSNNSSGRNGVSRSAKHPAWQVTWREEGRYRTRSFADSKFGGKEGSWESACLFRDQIDQRLGITNGKEPIQT